MIRTGLLILLLCLPEAWAQAPTVKTVRVLRSDLRRTVRIPGSVLSFEQATLISHLTAYVKTVVVREGSRLAKGAPLATLEIPLLAESLRRARAAVHAAEAAAGAKQAQVQAAKAELKVSRARAKRYRAEADLRQVQLNRLKVLRERKAATLEQVENAAGTLAMATAAAQEAEAGVGAAQASVEAANAEFRRASAQIGVVEAEAARLGAMQSLATIRCPYANGLVTRRQVDPGALVAADTTRCSSSWTRKGCGSWSTSTSGTPSMCAQAPPPS